MAERDDELLKRKSEKIDAVGKVYLSAKKARRTSARQREEKESVSAGCQECELRAPIS